MQHRSTTSKIWHKYFWPSEYEKVKKHLYLFSAKPRVTEKAPAQRKSSIGAELDDANDVPSKTEDSLDETFKGYFLAAIEHYFDVKTEEDETNSKDELVGKIKNLSAEEAYDLRIIISIFNQNYDKGFQECVAEIRKFLSGNPTAKRTFKTPFLKETMNALFYTFEKLVLKPKILLQQQIETKQESWTLDYSYKDYLHLAFDKTNVCRANENKPVYSEISRRDGVPNPRQQVFIKNTPNMPADLKAAYESAQERFLQHCGKNKDRYSQAFAIKCWDVDSKLKEKGVILLVQGENESIDIWNTYAADAVKNGYKVIAYKQRYFDSGKQSFDLQQLQLDFQKVFEKTVAKNSNISIQVVGHGLGSSIVINSLSYLQKKSNTVRIEKVSLFSPALLKGPRFTWPFRSLFKADAFANVFKTRKKTASGKNYKWSKLFDALAQTFKTLLRYGQNPNKTFTLDIYADKNDSLPYLPCFERNNQITIHNTHAGFKQNLYSLRLE